MRFTFMRKCTSSQKVREGYNGTLRWWMETILRDQCVNHRQTIDQGGVKEFGFFLKNLRFSFVFHPLLFFLSVLLWTTLKPERWINCMNKDLVILIARK